MTGFHFLTKNVFWENAVEYLRYHENLSFQTFAIVFSTQENVLVGISGALGMKESHFLSKNVFWENAVGYLKKWWMLELLKLCYCVQDHWKAPSRDFCSSRNERKPLSQQKCVLRKCCGESQIWWGLELSNLCHCIQHPGKLTGRDF